MKYGKLKDGRIEYVPNALVVDGRLVSNPPKEVCLAQGWKMVFDHSPMPKQERNGWHWERGELEETTDRIRRQWKLVRDPRPVKVPRTFVTADLVEALMAEGVWEQARAWIVEQGMLDLVLATKEFDETNENFQAGKAALQTALGWTDTEVEELLAQCVKEGA